MANQAFQKNAYLPRLTDSCLKMTERLLQKHKYRIAGTPECRQASRDIADHFQKCCDAVLEEPFQLHPKALWYVGKVIAVAYLLAAAAGIVGGYFMHVASLLCILGLAYGTTQYVFYGRLFDRVFKSAAGWNVTGSLEPSDAVRQQIVLVGHHDSPYIFSFLERFQSIAFVRFLLGILFYACLCVFTIVGSVQQLMSSGFQGLHGVPFWTTVAGLPFTLQLFFMVSSARSPGAGDNLNSTSMIAMIAEYFHSERHNGLALKNTRLVLLSTDGEEIGQRGSIHYVQIHSSDLHAIPTLVLNIDSIYHLKDLKVLTRDRNFSCKLSNSMVSDIRKVAKDLGLQLKHGPVPFGGGGTDAAAFSVAGVDATSLIGMPTGFISSDHHYHTSKDTMEQIEAAAVTAVLQMAIEYIRRVDNRGRDVSPGISEP